MKKIFLPLTAIALGLTMLSCSAAKKAMNPAGLQGEWNISQVNGKPIAPSEGQSAPFIGFDFAQKRIFGTSGCNRMMASFEADTLKPGVLSFGAIASTRMACPDMTDEQAILSALAKVKSYATVPLKSKDSPLEVSLNDEKGAQMLLLEKKPESQLPALQGTWAIKTIDGAPIAKSEKTPFLGFSIADKRIYGTAGCNAIGGFFETDEDNPSAIVFEQVISTMMACPDMAVETAILKALNEVKSFKLTSKKTLAFYNSQGKELISLEKVDIRKEKNQQ